MGQAKNRGTREQRVHEAIAREFVARVDKAREAFNERQRTAHAPVSGKRTVLVDSPRHSARVLALALASMGALAATASPVVYDEAHHPFKPRGRKP